MPIIFQTTDVVTAGAVAVPVPFQTDLIVGNGVTLASPGNHAISGVGDNVVIVNRGALVANTERDSIDATIQIGVVGGTSTTNAVTIAEGATVYAASTEAIRIEHGTNLITNHGLIDSERLAVGARGTSSVVNFGEIRGDTLGGVWVQEGGDIQNFGTIATNRIGANLIGGDINLINAGLITGDETVRVNSGHSTVNNSGTIQGNISAMTATNGGTVDLINSGTMSSTDVDNPTIAFGLVGTTGENTFTNSGSILSQDWAIDGHDGRDTVTNTGTITGSVNLNGGNDIYDGRAGFISGIINGGSGNDLLIGGALGEELLGGGGNDRMFGNGGNDGFDGDEGDDLLYGGKGDDFGDGGDGNDDIRGGMGDDFFEGGAGNDVMRGGQDRDELLGENGEDLIYGGEGRDLLFGNANRDTLFGGNDDDELYGGSSADALRGGMGHDTLDGGKGADLLYAGAGDDVVEGGDADDAIRGGAGDDTLNGGAGADSIKSGKGDDEIRGGSGADVFIMTRGTGNDHILDFENGVDLIDISAFGLRPGDYAGVVQPAVTNAGGGATFMDLTQLGGEGSILIEGLAFANAGASDFIF